MEQLTAKDSCVLRTWQSCHMVYVYFASDLSVYQLLQPLQRAQAMRVPLNSAATYWIDHALRQLNALLLH